MDLVACQSASAREAVEVLCGLIDDYGSSEVNIALIADQKEVWYVEMYNGHQYAAVRLPSDAVCVFGNEFSLEYVSDYEDAVLSPDLERLAVKNGFAVYGRDRELNLLETYSGDEVVTNYSHMRTWIGHQILSPSSYGVYDRNAKYPLCFAPDKKVSLQDVMELICNRFEGTEYSPDETGRTDMQVIGTDTALSVHIAQIYPDLPADMACVTWESTGPAVYGVFVPVSNASLRISEPYSRNQSAEDAGVFDTENYPLLPLQGAQYAGCGEERPSDLRGSCTGLLACGGDCHDAGDAGDPENRSRHGGGCGKGVYYKLLRRHAGAGLCRRGAAAQ